MWSKVDKTENIQSAEKADKILVHKFIKMQLATDYGHCN